MTMNESEIAEYAEFVASLGAVHVFDVNPLLAREGGSRAPEGFQISSARRAELVREFTSAPQLQRARPLDEAPCTAAQTLHIEPNGELRPCTSLEVGLGHALTDGIASAHASNERAVGIRNLTWANIHGCRECDLRPYCSRCYATALAQAGDALGPYPGACRATLAHYEAEIRRPVSLLNAEATSAVGPYREIGEGLIECRPDVVTSEDDALALRLGWTRRAPGPSVAPASARPGELVQIRRPGRKIAALERIPTTPEPDTTAEVARATIESVSRSNAS
jgi:radical SAM protein with 4Fe4S-binding SPASM domain